MELIEKIVSDENGHAKTSRLEVGKYYIKIYEDDELVATDRYEEITETNTVNASKAYESISDKQYRVQLIIKIRDREYTLSEVEYSTEKIKNISDEYKASVKENILDIYIPEPMPSYKSLKTHAFKNILLNIAEVTKPFNNMFKEKVFVFISCCYFWSLFNKINFYLV